jgi:hypothetical protein
MNQLSTKSFKLYSGGSEMQNFISRVITASPGGSLESIMTASGAIMYNKPFFSKLTKIRSLLFTPKSYNQNSKKTSCKSEIKIVSPQWWRRTKWTS